MAYLSEEALRDMGFAALGRNVKISDKAVFYGSEQMCIEDISLAQDLLGWQPGIDLLSGMNELLTQLSPILKQDENKEK